MTTKVPFSFKNQAPTTANKLQAHKPAVARFAKENQFDFKWHDRVSKTQGHCEIDGRQVFIRTCNVLETKGSIIVPVDSSAKLELAIRDNWFILVMNPDTGSMILYEAMVFAYDYANRKFQQGKFGEYFFLDLPQEAVAFKVGEDVSDEVIEF